MYAYTCKRIKWGVKMDRNPIEATLDDYAQAYCEKDIDAMMAVFANDDNISVIGTGEDEFCVGHTEVKLLFERNFAEASAQRFEWQRIDTRVFDEHAVMSVKLVIHLIYEGEALRVPVRWTAVVREINERWAWVHRHASSAASDQDDGAAYPKDQ